MEEMSLEEYQEKYMGSGRGKGKSSRKKTEEPTGRRNQRKGDMGEKAVELLLGQLGLVMVEKVNVGWTVIWGPNGRIKEAFPQKKVSGDFRAVTLKGQSVLVEVKTYDGDRLQFSALAKHQSRSLDIHQNVGGLSLLVWVNQGDIMPMWWPVEGFGPGKSLTREVAMKNRWNGEI